MSSLRPMPSKPGVKVPRDVLKPLVTAKQLWLVLGLLASLFAAGAAARAKVFKVVTGVDAQGLIEHLDKLDARDDLLAQDYDHLHEEIRDARQDFRDYAHGDLKPLAPEPSPSPIPRGTP